jgi:prophage lambdaBa04, DNA binding protein
MNVEDKLQKIIEAIEQLENKLETIQTETVFYDADDLARIMKIGKTKAYNLMNYKGFPVQKIGKRKVVESQALQRWGAIGRQLYI